MTATRNQAEVAVGGVTLADGFDSGARRRHTDGGRLPVAAATSRARISRPWARLVGGNRRACGGRCTLDMPGFGDADKPETFPLHDRGLRRPPRRRARAARSRARPPDRPRLRRALGPAAGPSTTLTPTRSTTLVDTGILYGYSWHAFAKVWRTRGLGELFFASHDPFRAALGAETRPAGPAAGRGVRALLQGQQGQGHPAGGPSPLPRQPAERSRTAGSAAAGDEPADPGRLGRARPLHQGRLRRAAEARPSPTPRSLSSRKAATGRCGTRRRRSRRRSSPSSPGSSALPESRAAESPRGAARTRARRPARRRRLRSPRRAGRRRRRSR